MTGLDPRHKELTYNLCKFCDNSHETIPKIMKRNQKKYGCGDALGLKKGNVKIVIMN